MRLRRQPTSNTLTVTSCLARLIDEQDQLTDVDRERLTRAADVIYDDRHAIRVPLVHLFFPNPDRWMVADARRDIADNWRRYHPDEPVKERWLDIRLSQIP